MDLNIRNLPDELGVKLKIKAVKLGTTLRDLCIGVLESSVAEPVQVQCPLCGEWGALIKSGTNALCAHCGSGFIPPDEVIQ